MENGRIGRAADWPKEIRRVRSMPSDAVGAIGTLKFDEIQKNCFDWSDALSPFIRKLVRDCDAAGAIGTEIPVLELLAGEAVSHALPRWRKGGRGLSRRPPRPSRPRQPAGDRLHALCGRRTRHGSVSRR
jgi:hypothetical protein